MVALPARRTAVRRAAAAPGKPEVAAGAGPALAWAAGAQLTSRYRIPMRMVFSMWFWTRATALKASLRYVRTSGVRSAGSM